MKSQIIKLSILILSAIFLISSLSLAGEKGQGKTKSTPPGWEQGKKTGWEGEETPPGMTEQKMEQKQKAGMKGKETKARMQKQSKKTKQEAEQEKEKAEQEADIEKQKKKQEAQMNQEKEMMKSNTLRKTGSGAK